MPKNKVNNNIKLKSGGGIVNDATDGLSVADSILAVVNPVEIKTEIDMVANKAVVICDGTPTANGTITSGGNDGTNYATPTTPFKISTSFLTPAGVYNIASVDGTYKFFMYSGSGSVTFSLFLGDANGKAIGSALYTSAPQAIATSGGYTSYTLPYSDLLPNQQYVVVADATSISGTCRQYKATYAQNANCHSFTWDGSAWVSSSVHPATFSYTATASKDGYLDYSNATLDNIFANNFIGFSTEAKSAEELIKIQTAGVVSGFTSLTVGAPYYLSNTSGAISTTPGSQSRKVGFAISATELLLQ